MASTLVSRQAYEHYIYTLRDRHSSIRFSTVTYIPSDAVSGRIEGMIVFGARIVLCIYEWVDFAKGCIRRYSYGVSRSLVALQEADAPSAAEYCQPAYPRKKRLCWYDSWPHPNDPTLASSYPHHKHIPPDIKHHRIPAPDLSFTHPNLPFLVEEIERELLSQP